MSKSELLRFSFVKSIPILCSYLFIGMAYEVATRRHLWGERINPPLYAWVEWLYARRTGDTSRLERAWGIIRKLHGMRHGAHEFLRPAAGQLPAGHVFIQAAVCEPVLKRLHRRGSILQPYS